MSQTALTTAHQKYPAYKDSGVECLPAGQAGLGEIPEHWDLLSNKYIFKLKKNLVGKKSSDYELLSLTLKGIIRRVLEDGGKFPAEFDTYQEVDRGDFIFCLFDVEETPRCVGLSDYKGMITGAYTVMDVNPKFDRSFLYYFYLNLDKDKRLRPLYTGLRNTISKDNFFAFKTFVPPKQEQTAIAHFLDDKTAKIDQAIAQKEKMIALLKERKQIIIQNAVTGKVVWSEKEQKMIPLAQSGVEGKDSGVEWIGEIPEHWGVKKLKYMVKMIGGYAFNSMDFRDSGVQIIKIANTYQNRLALERQPTFVPNSYLDSHKQWIIEKGDVLMSLTGTMGKTDYGFAIKVSSDEKFLLNQRVARLTPLKGIDPDYLVLLLRSDIYLRKLYSLPSGTKQANLSNEDVIGISVPVPPKVEMVQILTFIETQSAKINQAIALQQTQIQKLKEYKSTLIDSVVTGKIKII